MDITYLICLLMGFYLPFVNIVSNTVMNISGKMLIFSRRCFVNDNLPHCIRNYKQTSVETGLDANTINIILDSILKTNPQTFFKKESLVKSSKSSIIQRSQLEGSQSLTLFCSLLDNLQHMQISKWDSPYGMNDKDYAFLERVLFLPSPPF